MSESTFGAELRRLREQRGLSLKKFATLVHYDPGYLSKIENGLKPPTATLAATCDEALQSHGHLGQLASSGRPQRPEHSGISPAPHPSTAWEPDEITDYALRLTGFDLALSRRDALVDGTTALAGTALIGPLRNWLFPSKPNSDREFRGLSEDEVDAMEAGVRFIRSWARQRGGGMARKAAIAQLKDLSERLRFARAGMLRDRAFFVGAQLARLTASLAWDANSPGEAQRYYVLAAQMAHVSNDPDYTALALADLARQSLDLGKPRDALEVVHLAKYGSRKSSTARLSAFLCTREAWAHAHLNQPNDFRRAVAQAQDLFAESRATTCTTWLTSFDEAEFLGVIGARYRDLAVIDPRHAAPAEQYIRQALAIRAPERIRNQTFDLIGLARTYLISREPEQACHVAQRAMDINKNILLGCPKRKLHDFCQELTPYNSTATARDFSEYVRQVSH